MKEKKQKKMEEEWFPYYPYPLHCSLLHLEEEEGREEELKNALVATSMELEKTVAEAMGEIWRREEEVKRLKVMLRKTIRERDEAIASCERMVWEKNNNNNSKNRSRICGGEENENGLPEKGKLLKAVVEAGPLLHILLAAMPPSPVSPLPSPPPLWQVQQLQQQGRKRRATLGRSLSAV